MKNYIKNSKCWVLFTHYYVQSSQLPCDISAITVPTLQVRKRLIWVRCVELGIRQTFSIRGQVMSILGSMWFLSPRCNPALQCEGSHRWRANDGCGCLPIKLYLWALIFVFHRSFVCHQTLALIFNCLNRQKLFLTLRLCRNWWQARLVLSVATGAVGFDPWSRVIWSQGSNPGVSPQWGFNLHYTVLCIVRRGRWLSTCFQKQRNKNSCTKSTICLNHGVCQGFQGRSGFNSLWTYS